MIKGLHVVAVRKKGKPVLWYVYAWRGGPCIAKRVGGPRPTLTTEELGKITEEKTASTAPPPGSLAALIRKWRGLRNDLETASEDWRTLEPSTRETWMSHLDLIEEKWGKTPIAIWNDARMAEKVMAWRDSRAATPRSADIGVDVLSALLKYGRLIGWLAINVAAEIPNLYHGGNREEIIWKPEDVAAFDAVAPQAERDVLHLALLSGLRSSDLAGLKWTEVGAHAIVRTAKKKSRGKRRRATVPIVPALRTLFEELATRPRQEGVDTVLVTASGKAWTNDYLTTRFLRFRDRANDGKAIVEPGNPELQIPDRKKHLHDARGTFCTHLCRADLTDEEIARVMGWSKDRVANIRRVYVDDAAIVVALAERIAAATVKRPVKHSI